MLKLEKNLLLATCLALCFLGLFFVFESSALESFKRDGTAFYLVRNQALGFLFGLVALLGASYIKVRTYLKFPYLFYLLALIVSLLCFFPGFEPILRGNVVINGARRWIYVFNLSIQVAEIVKFCAIVFFAYLLTKTKNYLVFLFYLSPLVVLMTSQKDLGSLLVIIAISFTLFILSGAPLKKIASLSLLGLIGIFLLIIFSPYRRIRFLTFINPEADPQGKGYHINQLLIAIGRGELMGQGIGESRQKFAYVPEVSSDSIFSIVAEEVGFIGVTLILFLYFFFLALIWRIVCLSQLEPDEKLLGFGIFTFFVAQVFINLGGISGLIPFTGITLPFFSAGGSSLLICLFLVGIICNLANQPQIFIIKRRHYV